MLPIPDCLISRNLCSTDIKDMGAAFGLMTDAGCGLNVTTAAFARLRLAMSNAFLKIFLCPRCTPSNTPIAMTRLPLIFPK
jgi:hypothetical protein